MEMTSVASPVVRTPTPTTPTGVAVANSPEEAERFVKRKIKFALGPGVEELPWWSTSTSSLSFDDADVEFVVDCLLETHNTTLKELHFGGQGLTERGAKAVAKLISNNSSLEIISLRVTKVGDIGALSLAESLKNNNALLQLDLAAAGVTAAGSRALVKAIEESNNYKLERLDVRWNAGDPWQKRINEALTAEARKERKRKGRGPGSHIQLSSIRKAANQQQPQDEGGVPAREKTVQQREQAMSDREKLLECAQGRISKREDEVANREKAVQRREQELDEREAKVAQKEKELESKRELLYQFAMELQESLQQFQQFQLEDEG